MDRDAAAVAELAAQEPEKSRKIRYEIQVCKPPTAPSARRVQPGHSPAASAGGLLRPAAQSLFASHNAHCPQDVTQPLAFENRGFSFVIDKVRGAGALGTDVVLRGAVDTSRASCATALLVNVCTPYMPRLLLQGTIDQLLGSGSSRQQAVASATAALRVLHAAMRPGGTLLLLSHSSPARRTQLLSCCNWEAVQVREQRARWAGGSCHVQLNVLFALAMCAGVTAMHVRPSRALYAAERRLPARRGMYWCRNRWQPWPRS